MNAIIVSALLGVIMMFSGIFTGNNKTIRTIAVFGMVLLLAANLLDINGYPFFKIETYGMLLFSKYGLLFNSVIIFCTLLLLLLSGQAIEKVGRYVAEYHALIFFILAGISILCSYNNLLMLFLGVEIMSIPLYILTGSEKKNLRGNEASLKYFLMGSFSTGIMLMGIALLYGASGSFDLLKVNETIFGGGISFLSITGIMFLMISMAFKVSAAPFHFWTPDVYDGAPTVFTSFMATIVKAGGFIAFVFLFVGKQTSAIYGVDWKLVFSLLIFATLLVGNITAVYQLSVKRMLSYSSIAQAGFMLFALFGMNDTGKEGLLLYTAAYSLATIGAFAVLIKVKDISYEGFNGLGRTQPVLAATNTVFMLSLSGIPLTAGFLAKYYMLLSAVQTGSYMWLVIAAVVFAAVSVYYYFKVIQAMYFKPGNAETEPVSAGFKWLLIIVSALIILLGIFPQILIGWMYF